MTETVLTADGKPADRTNSLEGRRETDLQDKPLDGRRETDQQADNAGAFEREIQRCPKPPEGGLDGKPSSPTQAPGVWPRGIEAYSVFRDY